MQKKGEPKRRRGRPLRISWSESQVELRQRYEQEEDAQRKQRLRVLLLIRQGHSVRDASAKVGVGYRTAQQWLAWYRKGGLQEVLERLPGYRAPGNSTRLSPQQIRRLRERAAQGDWETVHDAAAWVNRTWSVEYTYQGMYTLLRREAIRLTGS